MGTWKTANTANGVTANAAYTWWLSASAMTEALDAWYIAMAAKPNSISKATTHGASNDALSTDIEEAEIQTGANAEAPCVSSASTDTGWNAAASGTSVALCKLACVTVTVDSLVASMDYNDGAAKVNGSTAKFEGAGHYCGAYSFDNTKTNAAEKCTYLKDVATAPTATTTAAGSKCFVMAANPAANPSYSAKSWYDLQAAVKGAWDTVSATSSDLQIKMATAMGVQADLEKAWLNAYYDQ